MTIGMNTTHQQRRNIPIIGNTFKEVGCFKSALIQLHANQKPMWLGLNENLHHKQQKDSPMIEIITMNALLIGMSLASVAVDDGYTHHNATVVKDTPQ